MNDNARDNIVSFEISDKKKMTLHTINDIKLYYVLSGTMYMNIDGKVSCLIPDSFIVANQHSTIEYTAESDILYMGININYYRLCRRIGNVPITFSCNSTTGNNDEYEELRILLKKIFRRHPLVEGGNPLYLEGLFFLLLDMLVTHFSTELPEEPDEKFNEQMRIKNIEHYVRDRYTLPLSLEELAEVMFFSPSYMSKFFKKHFNMSFSKYLTKIRLEHAVAEISKANGSKSLTRIAMDNGFPNNTSFISAFKSQYGITPSEYTKELSVKSESLPADHTPSVNPAHIKEYLKSISLNDSDSLPQTGAMVEADSTVRQTLNKYWNKLINIARASELFDRDMRECLLMMKSELGIGYVRFWDLYSLITLLNFEPDRNEYNFTKLDRIFDFLVESGLYPFLELGFKPYLLIKQTDVGINYMVTRQSEIIFQTPKEYEDFVYAFLEHYVDRYELEEVEKWCFEQWIDPRLITNNDYSKYFDMFEAAYRAIKRVSPHIKIGGGGISYSDDDYKSILRSWHNRPCHPDYFSCYCYPYTTLLSGRAHRSMAHQVEALRDAVAEAGFPMRIDCCVTEWNFTVSDRNPLNDSCFKAAYIVKNVLEGIGHLNLCGYWYASDLISEYADTNLILSGGNGLLSRDSIKKPAYHAFALLNTLGKFLIYNDEACAITTNGHGNYSVICHNYKRPNMEYVIKTEDGLQIKDLPKYFVDNNRKVFRFRIKNVENGSYRVKIRSMSDENGSIHSEWENMDFSGRLSKEDVEYLKRICVPRITITEYEAKENTLFIESILLPQEIQHIHITRKTIGVIY